MIGKPADIIQWLRAQGCTDTFEIKKYHAKRTLNSNSYCWALIGKIADELRTSKEEVYLEMLERYGQSLLIPVIPGNKPDGFFKYYKFFQESTINGKKAEWYKVFKGSSQYNTKEMSILIDGIVSEARDLGIETIPPEEIEMLKGMWGQ